MQRVSKELLFCLLMIDWHHLMSLSTASGVSHVHSSLIYVSHVTCMRTTNTLNKVLSITQKEHRENVNSFLPLLIEVECCPFCEVVVILCRLMTNKMSQSWGYWQNSFDLWWFCNSLADDHSDSTTAASRSSTGCWTHLFTQWCAMLLMHGQLTRKSDKVW